MGGESLTFLVVGINSKRRNDAAKKAAPQPTCASKVTSHELGCRCIEENDAMRSGWNGAERN